MPLDPPNVRVKVILKGAAKQEVRSPDPIPRPEAEEMIETIRKAQTENAEVELSWLTVSGADVTAAYIEIDPQDPQHTPDEILAELEKMGVLKRDED